MMPAAQTARAAKAPPPSLAGHTRISMRATVTRKALSTGLGLLERIIPTRSSNPGLTLLRVDKQRQRVAPERH